MGHSPLKIVLGFIFVLIGLLCLTIVFENFMLRKLRIYERILLIGAALLVFEPGLGTSIVGAVNVFLVFIIFSGGPGGELKFRLNLHLFRLTRTEKRIKPSIKQRKFIESQFLFFVTKTSRLISSIGG